MRPHALPDAAQRPTGSAALTTCTVLPLLPTAPSLPRRPSSGRWPRTGSADLMRPHALPDAAQRPTGSAALTTCTVLPLLPTAPSLPRRPSSWRWPRTGSVDLMRPHALPDAAPRPTGSAALTTCTVLPPPLTAPFVAKKAQLMKMAKNRQCGPDETSCPAGCCPEANWFCCPDNMYCAATAADCPFVAKKAQLMKMAKNRQCGPDETSCPAGCCPEANWFCCPDNMYCAATAADCPFVAKKAQLMKMAKNR